jgi:hypothetical protein
VPRASLALQSIRGCTYTLTVRSERKRSHWFVKLVECELGADSVIMEDFRLANIEEMEHVGGGIIQGSWKYGVEDSRLQGEICGTLTFAKGTFGLEEGCSDDEGFNVSHKCRGIGRKLEAWKVLLPPVAQFYLQSRDWHGGVTATVPEFSDLVCSHKGHHQTRADGSDRQ